MKKIICFIILTALVLTAFAGCAKTNKEGTEKNVDDIEMFIPDFPNAEIKSKKDNYIKVNYEYENVSKTDLDKYISELKSAGFECDASEYSEFLYRNGIVIDISHPIFREPWEVRITKSKNTSGGVSAEKAIELVSDEKVFLMIDETPNDLFETVGIQLFSAPFKIDNINGYDYHYYFVGNNGAEEIKHYVGEMFCVDIDGDGNKEIVMCGYGETSGIDSFRISVYSVENGCTKEMNSMLMIGTNWHFSLTDDERVLLKYTDKYSSGEEREWYVCYYDGEIAFSEK